MTMMWYNQRDGSLIKDVAVWLEIWYDRFGFCIDWDVMT